MWTYLEKMKTYLDVFLWSSDFCYILTCILAVLWEGIVFAQEELLSLYILQERDILTEITSLQKLAWWFSG